MKTTAHLVPVLFLSLTLAGNASALPLAPQSVGSLGDSVTAGSLAKYRRDSAESWLEFVKNSSSNVPTSFPELTWATGTDPSIGSLLQRLASIFQILAPPSANFAIPGAEASNVKAVQMPNLKAWSQKTLGKNYPDLVTLFIGGNDLCAETPDGMTPVAQYESTMRSILTELLKEGESTRVQMVPIPKVFNRIQQQYGDMLIVGSGATSPDGKDATCQDFWDLYENVSDGCPTVMHRGRDAKWIKTVGDRLDAYNQVMASLTSEYSAAYPSWDGSPRLALASSVLDMAIEPDQLSVDCFHPSAIGQARFAEVIWADSPYGN